jgi:hypothetical protein
MSALRMLGMYGRFMVGLPGFLRRRVTLEEAEAYIRAGLADRESNFLRIAKRGIFDNPESPYGPLLALAGCEFGDLESSVRTKGLEETLRALRAEGVYVTFEEYKGRKPIVRRGRSIEVDAHSFDNPLSARAYEGETGGSTGAATRVGTDLDNIRAQAPHLMLGRHVHGVLGKPAAVWKGALPDPVGLEVYLRAVVYDRPPERWFTPVTDAYKAPPLRFRLANSYVLWMSRLCGVPCPWPEPLPLDQAVVIARWASETVARHGGCQIVASVSLGVRVCHAAREAGIDLTGALFFGGGEPMTAAKQKAFTAVGARHVTIYISVDAGPMGLPCASPLEENEQHLLEDNLALIQYPRAVEGSTTTVDAFYFTSLRYRASKLLLNMESDDYGIVEERSCGCPLEQLGYRRHVRRIRSFGKLTGEGVTLVGSEMVRVLEEVLPKRFGGGPQDYQLLEEEDERGLTRLVLLVSPTVEVSDDEALVAGLLEAVGEGSDAGAVAKAYWAQAGTFQVRREAPVWTARGKLPSIRVGG